MADNDLILYTTDDGEARFVLKTLEGQVWLSQLELADLFQSSKQNISLHVNNILTEGELQAEATVKEYLTVQQEGTRKVQRSVVHYALPMILAVGYRVRSIRGTQFRQWATRTLGEYMVKGFVMDDERLKQPRWDYFDELLERIRDIRSSELRFYQKVRDLFTLASWRDYINNFMTFNEQPLLSNAGQVSRKSMEKIAGERYDQFNTQRNQAEALEADRKEMEALEHLEKQLLQKRKNDSER
ncbi:RhuM family protein [Endozoicomonas sp. SESOKO1]|uniref:RhuM family protein n=1 Tax=Endozoicomonas sp. SESOKO1 TaxID=2828742 RepID=UPI002149129B|nr:RhuM family protein [Endozoicomonas sp. SESOKO1]